MINTVIRVGVLIALSSAWAEAADWYTGAPPGRGTDDWIVAIDSSINAATNGSRTASVVGTAALTDTLSQSGARVSVHSLAGEYRATNALGSTTGRQVAVALLGGYEWVAPGSSFGAYVGPQARWDDFATRIPGLPAGTGQIGVTGAINFYAKPTETTFAHAFASYSSIRNSYYARARYGWAVENVYVGPELTFLGDDTFRQLRIGAHVSGWKIGSLQLGFSAGYAQDAGAQPGAYAAIDIRAGF